MRFWTQFRLVYELTSGMMSNKFQIRDRGQAHWKSYLEWSGGGLAMKRSWNWAVWTGASLVFLGVVSYPLFFVRFPGLRDFPWANLPMIALGLVLLALGLVRAFRHPDRVSRQNFRQRPRGAGAGIQRIFPLRHFHRRAACATRFARRAASGPDGARFHAAGFAESPSEFDGCVEFSVHS